ncbi:MAG TPA: Amuc_1099 family pilus-like system protein, partial [Candidatus Methylacidiphilales bacterium]
PAAASWHRAFLLAALVLVIGIAGWEIYDYPGSVEAIRALGNSGGAGKKLAPLSLDTIAKGREQWVSPTPWTLPEAKNELFTSRRWLFFSDTQAPKLAASGVLINNEVPLEWLLQYNIDPSDPDVLTLDPDGDGFDVLAEYRAKTDPRDPKSHPSYSQLLRVKSVDSKSFRMTFASRNAGATAEDDLYQVNTPDGKKGSYMVKIGDSFEGFKVVAYRQKEGEKKIGTMTVTGDISELELKKESTGETVILVIRDEQDVPSVSANLLVLLPNMFNKPFTVAKGQEFTMDVTPSASIPAETLHYQFLSSDASGVTLVNPETKQTLVVPTVKPAELQKFGAK